MNARRVLVTGASGFLGNRVVEALLAERRFAVRAMAHTPGRAVRLARLPVEIVWADLRNPAQVQQAVHGADTVVHCAYGADAARERDVTVDGTRILAETARAAGVRRFIHVSTIAVYSYSPPPTVSEETAMIRSGDPYCDAKIDAERVIRRILPTAVILRMGNIYGPFSAPWTIRPLSHIREGKIVLVDGGEHPSNAIYVDNAVQAILLSIQSTRAEGETFFVTDDAMTWREWYGQYADWLGASLRNATSKEVRPLVAPSWKDRASFWWHEIWGGILVPTVRYAAFRAAVSPRLGPALSRVWQKVPTHLRERLVGDPMGSSVPSATQQVSLPSPFPPPSLLQIYASKTAFQNEKLKSLLGYRQRVPSDEALKRTRAWAEWAGLLARP